MREFITRSNDATLTILHHRAEHARIIDSDGHHTGNSIRPNLRSQRQRRRIIGRDGVENDILVAEFLDGLDCCLLLTNTFGGLAQRLGKAAYWWQRVGPERFKA